MELFVHNPGKEQPEIVDIEGTALVRELLVEGDADGHVWIVDVDEEVDLDVTLDNAQIRHHHHVHRGHCRRVEVVVRWAGSDYEHTYGPATTIKTVEKWAFGEKVADFSPEQAAKHVLAVPGADHFLQAGVHVGSLVASGTCKVVLDLLPRSRLGVTSVVMAPDQRALKDHLQGGAFCEGIAAGRWRLVSTVELNGDSETLVGWPFIVVAVSAARRSNGPDEFAVRFELSGYPNVAPTGGIWDLDANASLPPDRRPKGGEVAQLFRFDGWTGGATAMYAPWDRIGLQSHPDWAQTYPYDAWNPGRDLSFILDQIHVVLHSDEYLGV